MTKRIIFPRAWKQFFGLKYLNSLWIRNPGWPIFGTDIRDGIIRIGDKLPGSASLLLETDLNQENLFVKKCSVADPDPGFPLIQTRIWLQLIMFSIGSKVKSF
jgi:hypothetical protein